MIINKTIILGLSILTSLISISPSIQKGDNIQDNFTKIKSGIYISKTEVSNAEYDAFLNDYGRNQINQVNNEGWTEGEEFKYSFFIPFKEFYHINYKYENHPTVNVYQEGAKMYCNWLTDSYNTNKDGESHKVKFRLPTISEWKKLCKQSKKIDINYERLRFNPLPNNDNVDSYNITPKNIKDSDLQPESDLGEYLLSDAYVADFTTWPVDYYFEINPEVKHIYGNVSEWTSEPNIAIGGNWTTTEENEVTDTLFCNSYSPKIGFRVVMELVD